MFATPATQASNKITTVPAPIGGLNARDSLATMPETDAIVMENLWPQPYGVSVRKGWQVWNNLPVTIPVKTLAQWSSIAGAQQLFAWAGTDFYNVTVRGTVPTALITGLSNSVWQTVSLTNAAGTHLLAVNGIDDGIVYDNSGAARLVVGDGTTVNTWKTLDPKDAIQLTVFQHRLWAVKKDSPVGYYLKNADAYYGDFGSFDFGALFPAGGYLAFLATWTIDDGNGAEDHLVAVSSTGTAAVYQGLDPSDAASWHLVGVYNVGPPVKGRRSYTKVGGDLFILTQQGIVSMSGMLASTKVNDQKQSFPSDKIQFLISDLISNYSELEGWELQYVPKFNMLICNVPTTVNGANFQLACNQIISSWTQFTGMDSATWEVLASQPFFGDYKGRICIAWEGVLDDVTVTGDGGNSPLAIVQQAYSYFGSLGTQKQIGMYKPTFLVSRPIVYNASIAYNFASGDNVIPDGLTDLPDPYGSLWDQALWSQNTWYGGTRNQEGWRFAQGIGVAASLTMALRTSGETLWVSTDYSYRTGGIL